MTIEERERMLRLQMAEMHGVMPETPQIVVRRVEHADGQGHTIIGRSGDWRCDVIKYSDRDPAISIERSGSTDYLYMQENDLDSLIALLQKAKELMQGGV